MGGVAMEKKARRYSESHEWVLPCEDFVVVGVSDYAQQELGDIVFVELPELGGRVVAGEEAAVLESTKAAADVYSPVSGEVIEVNTNLEDSSGLVNEAAEGDGWLFKVKLDDPNELEKLMDVNTYEEFIG
jgi:glycine cleavage system H protein